jgi:indolepyruvate ferredoxin oxidoreductase
MLDLSVSLDDKYRRERGPVFMNGTQALVRLAMLQAQRDRAAGLNTAGFVSGYRGSPLAALDFEFWRARKFLEPLAIKFQPGVNEDLAATSVWGTQQVHFFPKPKHDGVFAMWYGKSPGVDRCGDVFKHANHAGTTKHGGVLAIVGDDHAQKSTSTTSQSEYAMMDAMIPVLAPADIQEFIDLGLFGFALSRYTGLWVAFKLVDSNIGASGTVEINPDRPPFALPNEFAMPAEGVHARWPDDRIPQEWRLKHVKLPASLAFARANGVDRIVYDSPKARLGIVAAGKAWLDLAQALGELGLDADACAQLGLRVLKPAMIWPLEPETIVRFADGLEEILVVEEKRGFIEDQIKTILYDRAEGARPRVVGKRDETGADFIPDCLELEPNQVALAVADRVLRFADHADLRARRDAIQARRPRQSAPVHVRTPFFCSGCPHNTSTVTPEGSVAAAGIGCHSMAIWTGRAVAFTHMGGEGSQWIGIAPFTDTPHLFQNVGDGTYYHSASLAIRAAVAANVNITFKLLFNDAVAMTGGQPIDGPLSVPQITRQLDAEGVGRIVVVSDDIEKYPIGTHWAPGVTLRHRDELDAVQRELREIPGVTILLYDQTCAAEKRRRRKRGTYYDPPERIFINELVCEGCGDCGRVSNCISVQPVETEFGTKRRIDQSNCNKDYSCIKGFCPSFVTVVGGKVRKGKGSGGEAKFPPLPEPAPPALDHPWPILVTGVGGTGVVTIGAIFGMAAHLENRACSVSDVVGLSQKNGPVLSQIVFAKERAELHSPQMASGAAKALIACDLVTTTMPDALSKLAAGTRAIVNLEETRTGEFVQNFDKPFEMGEMRKRLEARIDAAHSDFVPATRLALALMGDSIATNMFMAGFAWQKGLVPLSREAIEQAIKLNGAAVDMNLRAFEWGRRAAHDLATAERAAKVPAQASAPKTLDEIVARRAEFLTDYQNAAYAGRYRALVDKLRKAEAARAPGRSGLAAAAAQNFFKLMAYKDEYEVARLYTDGTFLRRLNEQFEGDFKLRFHLAPPLVAPRDPTTGHLQKRRYGGGMMTAFKLLAKLRFLRGTPFDLFGYTAERRGERKLVADYEALMDEIAAKLSPANHAAAVDLARIPERIRGYGHVKEANLAAAKRDETQLLAAFRDPAPARVAAE